MNRWSLRIGRVAGIDLYLHWTFLLIVAGIAFLGYASGEPIAAVASSVGLFLAVFACVALHEYGHALAAAQFGIKTRDIILLPIGGLARLEKMPEKPWQELIVAIAGPAVNVAIAAVLGVVLLAGGISPLEPGLSLGVLQSSFLGNLLMINIGLVLFNMLPSFPMDGGRVLRSLLAMVLPHVTATTIAARLGQVMAGLFVLGGLFGMGPMLFVIAAFIFFAAQAELRHAQQQSLLAGAVAASAMNERFLVVSRGDTAGRVAEAMWSGSQPDFPVLDDGRVVGLLSRQEVWQALQMGRPEVTVGQLMRRDVPTVTDATPIDGVVELLHRTGASTIVVLRHNPLASGHSGSGESSRPGEMVGLITPAGLHQWAAARKSSQRQGGDSNGAPRAHGFQPLYSSAQGGNYAPWGRHWNSRA